MVKQVSKPAFFRGRYIQIFLDEVQENTREYEEQLDQQLNKSQ